LEPGNFGTQVAKSPNIFRMKNNLNFIKNCAISVFGEKNV